MKKDLVILAAAVVCIVVCCFLWRDTADPDTAPTLCSYVTPEINFSTAHAGMSAGTRHSTTSFASLAVPMRSSKSASRKGSGHNAAQRSRRTTAANNYAVLSPRTTFVPTAAGGLQPAAGSSRSARRSTAYSAPTYSGMTISAMPLLSQRKAQKPQNTGMQNTLAQRLAAPSLENDTWQDWLDEYYDWVEETYNDDSRSDLTYLDTWWGSVFPHHGDYADIFPDFKAWAVPLDNELWAMLSLAIAYLLTSLKAKHTI